MATRKNLYNKATHAPVDDTHEAVTLTADDGDPATEDATELVTIDTETPEGQIILQLTDQIDELRKAF